MRIFRKRIISSALAALDSRTIARACGVSERTARSWIRSRNVPEPAARLLALSVGDGAAILGDAWRGWWLTDGALESPDGQHWTPETLGAWWIERQRIPTLCARVAALERGLRVDASELARLQRAADIAQRAAHELAAVYPESAGRAVEGEPAAGATRPITPR